MDFAYAGICLDEFHGARTWRAESWLIFRDPILQGPERSIAVSGTSSKGGRGCAQLNKELLTKFSHGTWWGLSQMNKTVPPVTAELKQLSKQLGLSLSKVFPEQGRYYSHGTL